MKLALFDFDGTLTTKDSLADFIQYCVGKPAYYIGLAKLSPILIAYVLRQIPNNDAKQALLSYFFKGWDYEQFQNLADSYSLNQIENILRPEAMEKLEWHKQQGHTVAVVSASMESWLEKWCHKHGVDLIATMLEVQEGKLTGNFLTKNCHGAEKVNRIKRHYQLSKYSEIYVYGDSSGDKAMLAIANKAFYRKFK